VEIAGGQLRVPTLAAGEQAEVPFPPLPAPADGRGECWLTVHAVLAEKTAWAHAGHMVAWGQLQPHGTVAPARAAPTGGASRPTPVEDHIVLGPARFDRRSGTLVALADKPIRGPRVNLWRAPTDNDRAGSQRDAEYWHARGLHRLRRRTVSVAVADDTLSVAVRSAAAASSCGYLTTYRWQADGHRLHVHVRTEPVGHWPGRGDVFPEPMADADIPPEQYAELLRRDKAPSLARIGLHWLVPSDWSHVAWFGAGPGEAYPDSRHAVRIGRFGATVEQLQTPYVRPQENGNRADARWAELTDAAGTGVRVEGAAVFNLAARRWSDQELAAARHQTDLVPGPFIHLHTDHAVQGIGSAAVGPGVLPQYRLEVGPAEFAFVLTPLVA
jgi:beta-galactosidase